MAPGVLYKNRMKIFIKGVSFRQIKAEIFQWKAGCTVQIMEGLKILCQAISSNGIKRVRYNHTRIWYRKTYHTRTVHTVRIWYVCTVRVRYEIRVWYPTPSSNGLAGLKSRASCMTVFKMHGQLILNGINGVAIHTGTYQ